MLPFSPPLANFIACALHLTNLHSSVAFAALYLLQRLRVRFPSLPGWCWSGHPLFMLAFMIASKMIYDETYSYSNKSWLIVGQGINQMEREMCSYLEWQLEFERQVRRDFKDRSVYVYPIYYNAPPLPATPSSMPSASPYYCEHTSALTTSVVARPQQPPLTRPPAKPLLPQGTIPWSPHYQPPTTPQKLTLYSDEQRPASAVRKRTTCRDMVAYARPCAW